MNESGRWDESDDEKTFENSDDRGGDDNCSDPEMSEGNKQLGRETSSKVMKTPSFLDVLKLLCSQNITWLTHTLRFANCTLLPQPYP